MSDYDNDLDEGVNTDQSDKRKDNDFVDLEIDELEEGVRFPTEDIAVKSIENWSFKALCPLSKVRYRKGKEGVKGRRCFGCPHGITRTTKAESKRPCQMLMYTGCPVKINMNEQDDGSWIVTTCLLKHSGHPITESNL